MRFRPAPLKAAAVLAAGFIAVRVIYRVLFHGADGTGPVLLALPEVRLPAPFAHVVMFGPVTTDGLWDAATSAVPIAVTILVFGLINAMIDLPKVFARGARRGPLRGIARVLVVAWATLPALAEAVRTVRFAQRLRGERGGVRLLAPVLARTLERATAVAAALELRGLSGRAVEGDCEVPVEVRDATLGYGSAVAVHVPDLTLVPGTLTVVTGPTGAGKSTLLRALAGLHTHVDGGSQTGVVRVAGHDRALVQPRNTATLVGVVLQNPRAGLTAESVRDEIGLALELRGVAPTIIRARVDEIAQRVGIIELLDVRVRELSAGQVTVVAIAAAIVQHPILLLVDEPLADLDTDARGQIVELLDMLAHEAGVCVVVAEHRFSDLAAVADRRLELVGSPATVAECTTSPRTHDFQAARSRPLDATSCIREGGEDAEPGPSMLSVRNLRVAYGERVVVDAATFEASAGEILALVGANGAGKSSLLAALALPVASADITIDGGPVPTGRHSSTPIALVPDASDDLFLYDTVTAECARAERRAGVPRGTVLRRWAGFIGRDATADERADTHPRDLSLGERRCLAIALQLARSPRVLLIDEPTRGVDAAAQRLIARTLIGLAASGSAVIVATHDAAFATDVAGRVLHLEEGRLSAGVQTPERTTTPARRGVASIDASDEPLTSRHAPISPRRSKPPVQELWSSGTRNPLPPGTATRIRPGRAHVDGTTQGSPRLSTLAVLAANLVAFAAFCWPLAAYAVPSQAQAAVPAAALAIAPLAALVVFAALDGTVRTAHTLALLGTLAAIGAAIRIVGTGVGGVEALFILLILAGRAFGPRFGLLLGLLTIVVSSLVWGGIGPWTPFQMFACAWVGAGAGLLPRLRGAAEVAMLCVYGVLASYAFGLIMNLWFWPFATGSGTGISYEAGAPVGENLSSFFLYSLLTSSISWDTLRAITTVIGLVVVGRAVLVSLRRAKPVLART
ncbi:ATP-binding cassette domain-containing protein [Microbacterium lacus]|uniref:ATP-binding cassette domain-containing protein n=1 Tax=Microbacterium lacus TaxID=415217 RepID=UPI00384F5639